MGVPRSTTHKVLAACLVATGLTLAALGGLGVILMESLTGLNGMGNPSAEDQRLGRAEDLRAKLTAGAVGVVGVGLVVGGVLRWPKDSVDSSPVDEPS